MVLKTILSPSNTYIYIYTLSRRNLGSALVGSIPFRAPIWDRIRRGKSLRLVSGYWYHVQCWVRTVIHMVVLSIVLPFPYMIGDDDSCRESTCSLTCVLLDQWSENIDFGFWD